MPRPDEPVSEDASGWRSRAIEMTAVFALCALVFVLLDGLDFFRVAGYQLARRDIPRPLFNTVVYAAAYWGCLVAMVVCYLHAWRPVRWSAYAVTIVAVSAHLAFKSDNGYGFGHHEAMLFWVEMSFLPDALEFFFGTWAVPAIATLGTVLVYELVVVPRIHLIRSPWVLLIPVIAVYANGRMLEATFGKVYQTPIPMRVLMLTHYAFENQELHYGEREAPFMKAREAPWADHIIVVMDESVRGDLLGINGAPYDTTPELAASADRFCNFGVASAISNLSSSSNILLQSGVLPDQLPDTGLRSLKNPSIFGYMDQIRFATYLIDAQIYSDKPPNFMTRFDLDALDGHLMIRPLESGAAEHEMDFRAIPHLVDIVSREKRSFTYVIKAGAHFPYRDKAPDHMQRFQPTLDVGETTRGTERTLNSYLNALSWTVDRYLTELVDALSETGERVLVVYTSDHGQSLLEERNGKLHMGFPHATPVDPPVEQAMVPLMLFGVGEGVAERLAEHCAAELRDRVSAFEIFPSLLVAAGYDDEEVRAHYSYSLFDRDAPRESRVFASGNIFTRDVGYQNWLIDRDFYMNPFELPANDSSRDRAARSEP